MKGDGHASNLLRYRTFARIFLIALGVGAIVWATLVFPVVSDDAPLDRIAGRIIEGELYKRDVLDRLLPLIDEIQRRKSCRPQSLRSAAIVRLRLVEEMIRDGNGTRVDEGLDQLQRSIRNALKCAPSDSFLWLVLFWAESTRTGFNAPQIDYLRLSYKLGPYEGWIALKRSRLALAVFDQLPADLAHDVLIEFAGLLQSGFYGEVVDIFIGPGWPVRDKLLSSIKDVPEEQRVSFARALYRLGYDVVVPGVSRPESRPWQ